MGIRLNGLPWISDQLKQHSTSGIIKNSPRTGGHLAILPSLMKTAQFLVHSHFKVVQM